MNQLKSALKEFESEAHAHAFMRMINKKVRYPIEDYQVRYVDEGGYYFVVYYRFNQWLAVGY